ncbi:MAG: hypothetical protein WA364_19970 [Candidatus Nitrosopolaris sp.]
MNSRLTLVFGIIVVVTASASTSLIPMHQVNAQVVPDLARGLPSAGFPHNPNGEICGHAGKLLPIPFC